MSARCQCMHGPWTHPEHIQFNLNSHHLMFHRDRMASKIDFLTTFGRIMTLTFDLLISHSNQFIFWLQVHESCKFCEIRPSGLWDIELKNCQDACLTATTHQKCIWPYSPCGLVTAVIWELVLYADDCALVAHSMADALLLFNHFLGAAARLSLTVSKSEVMLQPSSRLTYTTPIIIFL